MIEAFATIDAAWPWAAALVAALTLLYLLRPRRRQVEVPFGALWQQVLARAEAHRVGRRWRRVLSWLLMCAISGALWAALAERPLGLAAWNATQEPPARHTVVLVDVSASMATADGDRAGGLLPRTRLDEAQRRLSDVAASLVPGERVLLVAASSTPRTLAPWTSDPGSLREAAAGIASNDAALHLGRALQGAADALQGRRHPQIVLISDGGHRPPPGALPAALPLRWILVGPAARAPQPATLPAAATVAGADVAIAPGGIDNVAAQRLAVRADLHDPSRGVAVVTVRNDRQAQVEVEVELAARSDGQSAEDFAAPGAVIATQRALVPARASQVITFAGVTLAAGRFAARVRPAPRETFLDVAPFDDRAFAVAGQRRKLGVLVVGADNLFLEAALVAHDRFEVRRLAPDAYQPAAWARQQRLGHGADVIVLDQVAAPEPPGMPTLRLDLEAHAHAARGAADVRAPLELSVRAPRHPTMRGVSLQDVNVDRVRPLQLPAGAEVLIADRDGAAIVVASQQAIPRVDAGLDIADTDMGGRYLLPIWLGNTIEWLAGESDALVPALEPGRPWAIGVPVKGASWTWREPGGPELPARTSDDALLATSDTHGIHVFRGDVGVEVARPTVLAEAEHPGRWHALGPAWQAPPREAQRAAAPWRAWSLLAALAAAALWIEWAAWQRRRTV